MLDNNL